jgi:hypothetical protein
MIAGDPGAESVYLWTRERKAVARRGAGRTDPPFERGSGEGLGVHILTGPVAVEHAEPGDVLEVRILDIRPPPSRHASHAGRCFGSNAAGREADTHKKTLIAAEQDRSDVARRRAQWLRYRHRIDASRLVFIDQTWTKTNMAPRAGGHNAASA